MSAPAPAAPVDGLLAAVAELAQGAARDDLAGRIRAARARVARPSTVVCVVGEFKQGKSSLVNALLGRGVCPVDDDLATAVVTVVHHAPETRVTLHRRDGSRTVAEEIAPRDVPAWVSEQGNPDNRRGAERVDIGLAHPLLAEGIALVDTPGAGGLGAGHAAATLAFLPFADALVFVTDATSELSAPEVALLERAAVTCPEVVVALTKTDLAPAWARIAELDAAHLARAGLAVEIVPVSSALRIEALRRGDRDLDAASGVGALERLLREAVVDPARARAARRGVAEGGDVVAQIAAGARHELAALESAGGGAEIDTLRALTERLEHLRGPAARWAQVLGDRVTDVTAAANHRFRGALRDLGRRLEERVEELTTPQQWDELGRQIQAEVAEAVAAVFAHVDEGMLAARDELYALLAEEAVGDLQPAAAASARDALAAMGGRLADLRPPQQSGIKRTTEHGLAAVRGAQGGVMMLGFLSSVFPAGAAALLLSNPVTLGLGLVFAGKQVVETRRRELQARRQQARTAGRQFLDDVQFELTNRLTEAVRVAQRDLRDELGTRVAELHRTYSEALQAAQADARRSAGEREQRAAMLRDVLARSERLAAALGGAG